MAKTAADLLSEWHSANTSGITSAGRRAIAAGADEGGIFSFKDTALAIPRGIEGAVSNVYGLADTLAFDVLPNYDLRPGEGNRLFGRSSTVVGGAIEGITNFAVGFIPVAGWLGRSGKFGNLVDITTAAETAAKATQQFGKAFGIQAARGAAASAAVDFAAFGGQEERLSNLLESVPALRNDVTGFLAADEDDPEIIGRLKNVLEGLAIGALTEPLIASLRALKKQRGAGLEKLDLTEHIEDLKAKIRATPGPEDALERPTPATEAPVTGIDKAFAEASQEAKKLPKQGPFSKPEGVLKHLGFDDMETEAILYEKDLVAQASREAAQEGTVSEFLAKSARINPRDLTAAERMALRIEKRGLNLSNFRTKGEYLDTVRGIENIYYEQFLKEVPGFAPETMQKVARRGIRDLSDMMEGASTQEEALLGLIREAKDTSNMMASVTARTFAIRTAVLSFGKGIAEQGKLWRAGKLSEEESVRLYMLAVTAPDLIGSLDGIKSSAGRLNRSLQEPVHDLFDLTNVEMGDEAVKETLKRLGGRDNVEKALDGLLLALGDGDVDGVSAVMKLAEAANHRGVLAWIQEYWYNAMLSSPRTTVVTSASGMLLSMWRPLENALGSALFAGASAVRGNSKSANLAVREAKEEMATVLAFLQDTSDSMSDIWRAYKSGSDPLDPATTSWDTNDFARQGRQVISSKTLDLNPDSTQARAIDFFGRIVRTPSGLMTASDHVIKKKNVNAILRVNLTKRAIAEEVPPEGIADYVRTAMQKMYYQGQLLGPNMLYKKGYDEAESIGYTLDYQKRDYARNYTSTFLRSAEGQQMSVLAKTAMTRAKDVTLQTDLVEGSLGHSIQRTVANHPMLRFIAPFVRTPLNIIGFVGQRADVPGVALALMSTKFPKTAQYLDIYKSRFLKDFTSGDARVKAEAMGRIAAGTAVVSLASSLAYSGALTGRGPSNPQQRRILQDAGWQEYSFRIGDKYISYARIDPISTFFGTVADAMDYMRYSAGDDDSFAESVAMGISIGLAQNFTNKSYLVGIAGAVDMLRDPERRFSSWAERMAGSFIPTALAHAKGLDGDYAMRDVDGMLQAASARIPYLARDVAPYRNLFGEPILQSKQLGVDSIGSVMSLWMPIAYREVSDDVVKRELALIGHGIQPPRSVINGIDLRSFERNGQTAFDRYGELHGSVKVGGRTLHQAMKSMINSQTYQKLSPHSVDGLDSPRIQRVTSLVQKYRQAAYRQMLKEYQEVAVLDRQKYQQRRALVAGRDIRSYPDNFTPPQGF